MKTVLTIALAALLAAGLVILCGSFADQPEPRAIAPLDLDSTMPVIVRHETPDGVQVAPPETMPLWKYVEQERGGSDTDLRRALECDIHAGDTSLHLTHELIDGRSF